MELIERLGLSECGYLRGQDVRKHLMIREVDFSQMESK